MTVRRVMGTETEYAVSAPAVSHANPVQLSFDVIGAAAGPERSRIRWDYRQEDPVNDARRRRPPTRSRRCGTTMPATC